MSGRADEILAALPDGVIVLDPDGRIRRANAAAEEALGTSGLAGRTLETAGRFGPALAELARRAGAGGGRGALTGTDGPVEVRAAPMPDGDRVLVLRPPGRLAGHAGADAEMARLTELAAGLAHEIRNPLAGLKGAADLLVREVGAGPLEAYATVIAREAGRVEKLVRGLMDLARPRPPDRRPADVHEVLDEVLLLARAWMPPGLVLERRYDPSLPELPIDRAQLTQVVLNLVRNAAEAMENRTGRLTVYTGLALGLATSSAARGTRTMARIAIEDQGPGFTPAVLERLYTPFLTTKAAGSGLGLALCRRMVEAHGGLLEVRNRDPEGASVVVLLPVTAP